MSDSPEEHNQPVPALKQSAALASGTFLTMGLIDVLAHLGPTGLLVSGLGAYVAWKHGPELQALLERQVRGVLPSHHPGSEIEQGQEPRRRGKRSVWDRALGRPSDEEETMHLLPQARTVLLSERPAGRSDLEEEADDLPPPPKLMTGGTFLFSSVLSSMRPALERIYMGTLPGGEPLFCQAEDLCHVALAGSTNKGKTSIMRMLMAQLCASGAQVLLLNPHYSRYVLKKQEDWTPFEPYLAYDPMECRKYEVIEYYLEYTAKVMLPNRLEKFAHSQPTGRPYFLVLDELPSIVRHVKAAPEYMRELLEEGRKVGIYLISAAQDFLVKTIAPDGSGGAIRECYQTAYYLGGDATTARILLDPDRGQRIPEDALGRGVVMLRCDSAPAAKKAVLARVPYVDNEALYSLLGPSSYRPGEERDEEEEDELRPPGTGTWQRGPSSAVTHAEQAAVAQETRKLAEMTLDELLAVINTRPEVDPTDTRYGEPRQLPTKRSAERTLLERGVAAYLEGATSQPKLAAALGISPWEARLLMPKVEAETKRLREA